MKKIAYLLFIGLIFALLGCGTSAPMVTPKNESAMSMNEFNQIKNGMTYEQTTAIVGSPGEMVAETGNPGDQFYTVTYQFEGEGSSILDGAYAQLTFQSGKLNSKAQKGITRPIK